MIEHTSIDNMFAGEGVVLLINKPIDWTSFDVVKRVRALFDVRKVGHAGTLDPKATGLLIICTGEKTKSINQYVGLEKEYIGTLQLGARTPSFDTETAVCETKDYSTITIEQIRNVASQLLGKQYQLPPMYSAIKYGGKPLYRYAREGRIVERTERVITISAFDILGIQKPYIDFRITCSSGTYIRALIDKMGEMLACGAFLSALKRIRIGNNHLANAMTMEQLVDWRNRLLKKEHIGNEAYSTV